VLKKAGIITAGVAASLVAVSPLAFANEGHHETGGKWLGKDVTKFITDDVASGNQSGLVNVGVLNGADVLENVNVCGVDVDAALSVLGILGGQAVNDAAPLDSTCSNGNVVD